MLRPYDAGRARERLADEISRMPDFISSARRRRLDRSIRTLARVTGQPQAQVLADVLADAAILQEEDSK